VFSITLREVQGAAAGAAGAAGAGAGAGAGCTETRKVAGFELRDTMREGWTRCLTATSCSGREVVLSSGRQINVTAFERFVEEELEGKEGHLIVLVDTTSNLLSLSAEIKRRIVKLLCDPSSMVVACLTEDSTRMLVSCEELDAQCVLVAQSPTMFSSLAQFSLLQEETMEWSKDGLQSVLRRVLDGWSSRQGEMKDAVREGRTRKTATADMINKQLEHVNYLLHRSGSPVSSPPEDLHEPFDLKRDAAQLFHVYEQTRKKMEKKARKRMLAEQERRAFRLQEEKALALMEEEAREEGALAPMQTMQLQHEDSEMSDERSSSSECYSFPSADA